MTVVEWIKDHSFPQEDRKFYAEDLDGNTRLLLYVVRDEPGEPIVDIRCRFDDSGQTHVFSFYRDEYVWEKGSQL